MTTPTLKQLTYFAALAETRHFGRAAARCHVTQPALSMQIRELEANLGVALIERAPSGPLLTAAGEEVLRRAEAILHAVQDLCDLAQHWQKPLSGRLRLGVIPSVGPYLLPRVLPRLHRVYPDLELSLRESQTAHLVEDLVAGRLDLLILALPIAAEGVETLALFDDVFTLAVPATHRLARTRRVRQRELTAERLLLLEEGHCLRDQAIALCQTSHPASSDDFRASSLATVVQMVINGYGCTILPEMALPIEVAANRAIRVVRFVDPPPARTIGLAWRASWPRAQAFHDFGQLLIEAARPPADAEA